MANVKKFTKGQQRLVEKQVREALDMLDKAHRNELRDRADQYQRQDLARLDEIKTYRDRIMELRNLTKAMAKELSRR